MNTRIARRLNEAKGNVNPSKELVRVGEEITLGHNIAVTNGFLELPVLDFMDVEYNDSVMSVIVTPRAGMVGLNDLYNLKSAWGADDVNVLTADRTIELVFKK